MITKHDAADRPVAMDDALKAFIERGVSVVVGTRDEGLVPEIVRGWGPQLNGLAKHPRVRPRSDERSDANQPRGKQPESVTFSLPSTYRDGAAPRAVISARPSRASTTCSGSIATASGSPG